MVGSRLEISPSTLFLGASAQQFGHNNHLGIVASAATAIILGQDFDNPDDTPNVEAGIQYAQNKCAR
jgi:hypothetical protein